MYNFHQSPELLTTRQVTPNSLLFLSSPTASKHSAFPLNDVKASEVPALILTKFVSKEATSALGHQFETDLAARPCLCDVTREVKHDVYA